MPRSRKRHHSRSRSKTRSRSPSRDNSFDKPKKPSSNEKDGKRRRLDEVIDSPQHKRSLSSDADESMNDEPLQDLEQLTKRDVESLLSESGSSKEDVENINENNTQQNVTEPQPERLKGNNSESQPEISKKQDDVESKTDETNCEDDDVVIVSETVTTLKEAIYSKGKPTTPRKPLTPKQLQKKMESEKKKQQRQKERDEREKQRQDEKATLLAEKQKLKEQKEAERQKILEEKQKQLEVKQKEKELRRKEKEEQEAQKRKEKELEKLRKQQEIEEKNKEKQKEEEKKQKTVALFINFFKKTDGKEKETKVEKVNSNFMPFEVKSDMRLPPSRRKPLSPNHMENLDCALQNQDENASYLKELKNGKFRLGHSGKTWPYEEPEDEITLVEGDKDLGETICEDTSVVHKMKAKFLFFHENRRPAYFGTWRKKSKCVKPRRPFAEDNEYFNYEEDSDDDWEDEEQGESLEISGEDDEKDNENEEDEYEVDNDFFVPHGHLSDDELDDEENAPLSPEALKYKLKLLNDEFEEDMKSKTHKLKPRSIGCVWFNKNGNNVDDAIIRYLQPFAMLVNGAVEIKNRSELFPPPTEKKKIKILGELPSEHIPFFLKIIHGNVKKKETVIEEFLTSMANNGFNVDVSKANLLRFLKKSATYKRCIEKGPMINKFGWFVNDDVKDKYNVNLDLLK